MQNTGSPIEYMLLTALRAVEGHIEPTQQYEVYDDKGHLITIPDFAYPQYGIAVFCDGREYHKEATTRESDAKKRNYLSSNGWTVLVYSGGDIYRNADKCAREIHDMLMKRTKSGQSMIPDSDWLNRDKPTLLEGRHNVCHANDMYSFKYYNFTRLDRIIQGKRYLTEASALIALKEAVWKYRYDPGTRTKIPMFNIIGLFCTPSKYFYVQHEYRNSGKNPWAEAIGQSKAFEFYWNAQWKAALLIEKVFPDVGVSNA